MRRVKRLPGAQRKSAVCTKGLTYAMHAGCALSASEGYANRETQLPGGLHNRCGSRSRLKGGWLCTIKSARR